MINFKGKNAAFGEENLQEDEYCFFTP